MDVITTALLVFLEHLNPDVLCHEIIVEFAKVNAKQAVFVLSKHSHLSDDERLEVIANVYKCAGKVPAINMYRVLTYPVPGMISCKDWVEKHIVPYF